jgi:hypothetical protein
MDRTIAKELMRVFEEIGSSLNQATCIVSELPDVDEQKLMRRGLGNLMGTLFTELQLHIIRQYPDLDPDKGSNDI